MKLRKYFVFIDDGDNTMKIAVPAQNEKEARYYDKEKSFVDPDKRISQERSFKIIEEKRIERLKTITAYKEHLATWEEKKKQMEQLKKQLKTLADSIPYTMQDYFNMRVKYY